LVDTWHELEGTRTYGVMLLAVAAEIGIFLTPPVACTVTVDAICVVSLYHSLYSYLSVNNLDIDRGCFGRKLCSPS
jgi:hypothetical protein